jgi:hypothetical protein
MNAELAYHVYQHTIPAALDLLPSRMDTPQAKAMLLAIGFQESRFEHRKQVGGPAHGFWQFERDGGVKGVLTHPSTSVIIIPILNELVYSASIKECYEAIVHNDVLACVFARLLLYTVPGRLPERQEVATSWSYYLAGWRPGKPHPETWEEFFIEGWRMVTQE